MILKGWVLFVVGVATFVSLLTCCVASCLVWFALVLFWLDCWCFVLVFTAVRFCVMFCWCLLVGYFDFRLCISG